jgi:DNA (cytosine-5)-methyltransferase 1
MASEIDKYANQAYEILYGEPTVGDVTKIDAVNVPDHDLLVGGFPCQAFSVAGKRLGFDDTRGTLFFEIARIAKVKRPKAVLLENVKGLVGHDGGKTLNTIIQTLSEIGYNVDFNVLNSKYFGVPQNRERIFIIAVRDDLIKTESWRIEGTNVVAKGKRRISEIDGVKTFNFDWPTQDYVSTRLRDILESDVDERFYLSEDKTAKLVAQLENDVITAVVDVHEKDGEQVGTKETGEPRMVGHVDIKGHDAVKRVYDPEHVSPTLTTMGGGHREPKITEEQKPKLVGGVGEINFGKQYRQGNRVYDSSAVAMCLHAQPVGNAGGHSYLYKVDEIRPVLTPDRAEKRQNGRRFKEDGEESFTLTAQDKHGVAFGSKEELDAGEKERNTVEILRALRNEVGEETLAEWRLRILDSLQYTEVLQQRMYGEGVHGQEIDGQSELVRSTQTGKGNQESGDLREVWSDGKSRYTSHGRELAEQFARELAIIMSELSHQGTSSEEIVRYLWESTQGSRLLQQALHQIQKIRRPDVSKTRYRIRKLSPRECFRLQGFPDSEFDKLTANGISNSQLYKMAGNAVTVNVIDATGRRLLPLLGL